jgi:hypothetical protein
MQVTVEERRPDRITISVVHEDYQSFSRAVSPRAVREFQRLTDAGTWRLHPTYGLDEGTTDPHRCLSRFVFTKETS